MFASAARKMLSRFTRSIPMDRSNSGDFRGRYLVRSTRRWRYGARRIWLRVALARYSNDPHVLALGGAFRAGTRQQPTRQRVLACRAGRHASGSSISNPGGNASYPSGPASNPGDIRRLLNPSLDPSLNEPSPDQLAPLPSYKSLSSPQAALPPLPSATNATTAFATAPSDNPLPMPFAARDESAEQGTAPPTPPVFVSPRDARNTNAPNSQSAALPPPLTGNVHLSPSEENVTSTRRTDVEVETGITASSQPTMDTSALAPTSPPDNLRISSEPMNVLAAQAQARFAAQTDAQLTQGSAALIHAIPNATTPSAESPNAAPPQASAPLPAPSPISPAAASTPSNATPLQASAPTPATPPAAARNSSSHSDHGVYTTAQNTPSAQDAASGAYSAPQQQQPSPSQPPAPQTSQPTPAPASAACQTTVPVCPPVKPTPAIAPVKHKRPRKPAAQPAAQPAPPTQTLGNAPLGATPENAPATAPAESQTQPGSTTSSGVSDQELEQRNLPPLRGPWIRIQRQANPLEPARAGRAAASGHRERLQRLARRHVHAQLSQRHARLYKQLAAIESPFEVSAPLGAHARHHRHRQTRLSRLRRRPHGAATLAVLESATIREPRSSPFPSPSERSHRHHQRARRPRSKMPPASAANCNFVSALSPSPAATRPLPTSSLPLSPGAFNGVPAAARSPSAFARLRERLAALLCRPARSRRQHAHYSWPNLGRSCRQPGQVQVGHGDAQSGFYFCRQRPIHHRLHTSLRTTLASTEPAAPTGASSPRPNTAT
jgi:cellulose synthase operon protein C